MIKKYRKGKEEAVRDALKAKNVKVVNTPTVKIAHDTMEESKPHLYLSSKDLPEIKNWKVGNSYTLKLEVKQTSLSQNEYDGEKKTQADFQITSVKALNG